MVRAAARAGTVGFGVLAVWWVVHVERRTRPRVRVLPVGFAPTFCGTLLAAAALAMLAVGVHDLAAHALSSGGRVRSGDLLTTGATVLATALPCWTVLAYQATRPAGNARSRPQDRGGDEGPSIPVP